MAAVSRRVWPIGVVVVRSTALIAVTLVLIYVVLPAALVAAGPRGLVGG